jgi:hypothetical protein
MDPPLVLREKSQRRAMIRDAEGSADVAPDPPGFTITNDHPDLLIIECQVPEDTQIQLRPRIVIILLHSHSAPPL